MSDHIDELCALVKAAGGTMRLYGRKVSPGELRGAMEARVDAKLGALIGLPTPRLTATIEPRGRFGAVVVAGYTPPPRETDPADERPFRRQKARVPSTCRLCLKPGHIASNEKFHPRPL